MLCVLHSQNSFGLVRYIYLGVDCLTHGDARTLQCILLHTEVTTLAE